MTRIRLSCNALRLAARGRRSSVRAFVCSGIRAFVHSDTRTLGLVRTSAQAEPSRVGHAGQAATSSPLCNLWASVSRIARRSLARSVGRKTRPLRRRLFGLRVIEFVAPIGDLRRSHSFGVSMIDFGQARNACCVSEPKSLGFNCEL